MKKVFLPLFAMVAGLLLLTAGCQMGFNAVSDVSSDAGSRAVSGSPVGWGKSTTGGSGTSVTVNSYSALASAISAKSANIIYIDGKITMSGRITIQDRNGLSIIGKNGGRLVSSNTSKDGSGIFYIKRVTNLLIQNLTFEGPGAYDTDGYDNLCIDNCQTVWVDHCTFQDGVDGNFDIKNMSDNVSVTWCRFEYKKAPIAGGSGGSDDHRYSNLIGSSDSATGDAGKLRVTYYYCHWAEGCVERMPRIRYGQVHVLNCLFDSSVNSTSIRAAYKANVLVEGCYFQNQKKPVDLYSGYTAVKAKGNYGFSDMTAGSTVFTPGYSYSVDSASGIASTIRSNAGAGGSTSTPTPTTAPTPTPTKTPTPTATPTATPSGTAACNLNVTVSGTSAKLTWSYSNFSVKSQEVYRDTDSTPSGRVRIATVTGTTFTDSGLANGTYYYWIKSVSTSGVTLNSNADDAVIGSSATATPAPTATPVAGAQIGTFGSSGVSNSFFKVTGNYSNSKGTVTVDGKSYSYCLKMESATTITFTTTASATLTLVFGGTTSASGKKVMIDGTSYTTTASGSNYVVTRTLSAGTHTIKKVDSINLFYIKVQ